MVTLMLVSAIVTGLIVLSGIIDHVYGIGMAQWKAMCVLPFVASAAGFVIMKAMKRPDNLK